ncbi:conserved protein of unknown function [Tenacibaculum sp. 190524A02b]
MNNDFYMGLCLFILGILYMIYILSENKKEENLMLKLSRMNSWGLVILFVLGGIIIMFK